MSQVKDDSLTCFLPSFFLSFGLFFLKNLQKQPEQRMRADRRRTEMRRMTCHLLRPVLSPMKDWRPPLSDRKYFIRNFLMEVWDD